MRLRPAVLAASLTFLACSAARAESWKEALGRSCIVATASAGERGTDPKLDEIRDAFNEGLLRFFVEELKTQGVRVHPRLIPTSEPDPERAVQQQMAVLARNGCNWYLQMAFGIDRNSDGVVWVKVNEVFAQRESGSARFRISVGPVKYADEVRRPINPDKGQDFVFSDEAEKLARKFLAADRP